MAKVNRLTRLAVLERDGWKCRYCGCLLIEYVAASQLAESNAATVDHVLPKSRGGANSEENLVAACFRCNSQKADCATAGPHWEQPTIGDIMRELGLA